MIVQQLLYGLSLGSVYALIAVGFALVFNILKFSNFSHGGVLTVTAYTGYLIATKLQTNLWVTLFLTACVGGVLALIIEFFAFRRLRKKQSPLIFYFVSSITMGLLLDNLITVYFSTNFYSYPNFFTNRVIQLGPYNIATTDTIMLIISIVALSALMLLIYKTKFGVAIRALSIDAQTLSLMGVNVNQIIIITFFISGFLGGISGVFLGINYTLYPMIGKLVVKGFIASVLGGLGNISGAVIGALLLGIMEVTLTSIGFIGSGLAPVVIFVIMLVFLIVRPQGIAGIIIHEKA
ncbi:branched-chain amino acid ABC transporter permease [Alkalibacter rhizosphaerae]|uniref:Branched-chain amino acid ABC transporter permease n=1 Tax=Alkalibacter rhizosphaerae TaxID=2815577 RepID=A0A975AI89_9FIRM|nr:branched-chain amino acid ABC transporter permease [Alkalibacter rhizosphaerae]QSX09217.1 branched-chain amino acid ABC transporter permease [Alkalibacter rhizosphaerae]